MKLSKKFPFKPIFNQFLEEYSQCESYWYIPKARTINEENINTIKEIMNIIFDEFLGAMWGHETQNKLLNRLMELRILEPYKPDGKDVDRAALIRIWKKLLETLGLLFIKNKHEIIITDAGLELISAPSDEVTQAVIEKQIIRYQYPNPSLSTDYRDAFKGLLPHLFLLQVLDLSNHSITIQEYELFVNLTKSQNDLHRIIIYIDHWRNLSEDEKNELITIIKRIPIKKYARQEKLPSLDLFEEDQTRYRRINLNSSYQVSFFCFPKYLELRDGKIICVSPHLVHDILKSFMDKLKTSIFTTLEDWFAYFGDPTQEPSWFTYMTLEIEKAKTIEELRNVEIIIKENQATLSKDEINEIKYRQIEKSIETFYTDNLDLLEKGLSLVKDGRQYITPIGRIDLLCKGIDNSYVVIEIKADEARDSVFGQILRYIGWIHKNLPNGKNNVRGIILARQFSDKARYSRAGLLKEDESLFLKFRKHNLDVSNIE